MGITIWFHYSTPISCVVITGTFNVDLKLLHFVYILMQGKALVNADFVPRLVFSSPAELKINTRRKSYILAAACKTERIYRFNSGNMATVYLSSIYLPGAALPPETGVVSALTLTEVPVSARLWSFLFAALLRHRLLSSMDGTILRICW